MPANRKWKNPFYVLLIPTGLAFCVTAFAYSYMAFQQANASRATVAQNAGHTLFSWLREYGTSSILAELGVLAVLTVGAIATDSWWARESTPPASDPTDLPAPNDR